MGIVIFAYIAKTEYQDSRNITEPLTKLHLEQTTEYNISRDQLAKEKYNIKKEKSQRNIERLQSLIIDLPTNKIRLNKINQEKGASTWLSTLPLKAEGYSLSKQEFWSLLKIRYGWPLLRLLNMCNCGAKYDLEHSLSYKKSGFVTLRHNHLRNITANLIDQVCHDVRVDPPLQILTGKTFDSRSTNVRDYARLDISARGFWTKYQMAVFDVRGFDPNAKRYEGKTLQQCYRTNEMEKKRKYNERILRVENGSFGPLVLSVNGGMGKEANKCCSWIAKKLAEKRD